MDEKYFKNNKNILYNYNLYQNFLPNYIHNYRGNYIRGGRSRGRYNYRGAYNNRFQNMPPQNYIINQYIYPYNQIYNNQQLYEPYNEEEESLYRAQKYIFSKYHKLIDINKKNSNILKEINTDCKFFVIKSISEEDIHKSIKYGIWSSSKNGNNILSNAYNITKEKESFVYLFFSCNGSGGYVGVAKMKSSCDFNRTFEYWSQDNKWQGLFDIEWLFIKDVPFIEFKNIIITMRDGEIKPISHARDTQEIPYEKAKIMLNIIEKYENSNSILEHFEYYDMRQDNYDKNMKSKKQKEEYE